MISAKRIRKAREILTYLNTPDIFSKCEFSPNFMNYVLRHVKGVRYSIDSTPSLNVYSVFTDTRVAIQSSNNFVVLSHFSNNEELVKTIEYINKRIKAVMRRVSILKDIKEKKIFKKRNEQISKILRG